MSERDQVEAGIRLRSFIRRHQYGGCQSPSLGRQCQCPLCDADRLAEGWNRHTALVEAAKAVCDNAFVDHMDCQCINDNGESIDALRKALENEDE